MKKVAEDMDKLAVLFVYNYVGVDKLCTSPLCKYDRPLKQRAIKCRRHNGEQQTTGSSSAGVISIAVPSVVCLAGLILIEEYMRFSACATVAIFRWLFISCQGE